MSERGYGRLRQGLLGLVLGCLAWAMTSCAPRFETPALDLPRRRADARGGAALARAWEGLGLEAREARVYAEVTGGNVPSWFRRLQPIELTRHLDGRTYAVTLWVTADYLAVGDDGDALRMPLTPATAQRLADLLEASLPTPAMVDAIWEAADVQLDPAPIPPSPEMTTVPVFLTHHQVVEAQRKQRIVPREAVVAGHKKDVVLTSRLAGAPGKVAIYGWHRSDGRPIQPLYLGHTDQWVDYSHGIRLVSREILIDDERHDLLDLLRDPRLAPLLSAEGVLAVPRYPAAGTP